MILPIVFIVDQVLDVKCKILPVIIKETNVRGIKMSEKNPFEIVDGQVILHNEFQGIDETILNYEQVAAIKLLIQKCSDKEKSQTN